MITIQDRVLADLMRRKRDASYADIAKKTRIGKKSVSAALSRLKDKNLALNINWKWRAIRPVEKVGTPVPPEASGVNRAEVLELLEKATELLRV